MPQLGLEPGDLPAGLRVALLAHGFQGGIVAFPRGLPQRDPARVDRAREDQQVLKVAHETRSADARSAEQRAPQARPRRGPPGSVTCGLPAKGAEVTVAPARVEPGRVPDLGLRRVPEPHQHEGIGEGALGAGGEPEVLRDHAFASHTAANFTWGCLLTGSQSVMVSSLPAPPSSGSSASP